MSGEIREAHERLKDRQESAGLGDSGLLVDQEAREAAIRRSLVGLDIDLKELTEVALDAGTVVYATASQIAALGPLGASVGGWIEGFLTGMTLAETRRQEEARSS